MRRLTMAIAAVAAASAIALAVPGSALAAETAQVPEGSLLINDTVYHDPSGCLKDDPRLKKSSWIESEPIGKDCAGAVFLFL
ncbi:hypothetical protein FB566_2881 [Stackebrandtia endophytica]|uniref:Secreted protein n=1 Tax=Stackebrandtia endophytica TaxID=1496996 RepID=A0A543AXP8_9ACTN|nr:hypothetical protein [Stackebrandtia endophytica]TQL77323.1 hypothetical protein FB566_2881 [Stackebrandtia endophytica]